MSTVLRAGDRPVSQLYCDDRAVTSVIKGTTQIWPEVRPIVLPYLTFRSLDSFTLSVKNGTKNWDGVLEYSTDTETWSPWDGTTVLASGPRNAAQCLFLRGTGNHHITKNGVANHRFVITGDAVSVSGNIETLLDFEDVMEGQHPQLDSYCYGYLFSQCDALTDISELVIPSVSEHCCFMMFYECDGLSAPPLLPAMALAPYCYNLMFSYSGLSVMPQLRAMELAEGCYYSMFSRCDRLTTASPLPAQVLAEECYDGMFAYSGLQVPPALSALTLAPSCCSAMFSHCEDLQELPELPAVSLPDGCYFMMFYGCKSIKVSTTQTGEYQNAWRLPKAGEAVTSGFNQTTMMLSATGGEYKGEGSSWLAPVALDTTYYTSNPVVPAV